MISKRVGKDGLGLYLGAAGDIHFGHPNTTAEEIKDSWNESFTRNPDTQKLDILFLEGDVLDRALMFADKVPAVIMIWMATLLRYCKQHNIKLRVLEGTPSHDRGQSKYFPLLNELLQINADLVYVDTLKIEYFPEYGINVLYIPDEWRHNPEDTWKDVEQTLSDHALTQVDFICMHGAFTYQLPAKMAEICHNQARYEAITRFFIFIGHIHKHSINGQVLAAGSFERLTHGEEEPKGHIRLYLAATGDHRITFVENRRAKPYRTVECTGLALEGALNRVGALCESLPVDAYVRIAASKQDVILGSLDVLKSKFPGLHFSTKQTDVAKGQREGFDEIITPYTPAALTPTTVQTLLMERLQRKGAAPALLKRAEVLLNGQIA